jgi:hypothetical protein
MAHRSTHEVKQLLERYVFGIAAHFIDSADAPTQQALIDAASRFITLANANTDDKEGTDKVLLNLLSQPTHQHSDQATDRRFAHREWLASWVQQQQHRSGRQRITFLEDALVITRQRYQLIQDTVLREPYRSRLLYRCQQSLDHFQRCLDLAYTVSQASANWLSRL